MKPLRLLLVLLFLSCNAPRAYYDYGEQVDFSQFTTYKLFPELHTGLSELDEGRLLASLQNAMAQKGIPQMESPDFLINIYSEEFREPNKNSIGVGVGGTGRNVGIGISGGIPIGGPKNILSLTFDIIDAEKDELIWQAIVESKFDKDASPEKRKAVLDKMVAKALEKYPPR